MMVSVFLKTEEQFSKKGTKHALGNKELYIDLLKRKLVLQFINL